MAVAKEHLLLAFYCDGILTNSKMSESASRAAQSLGSTEAFR